MTYDGQSVAVEEEMATYDGHSVEVVEEMVNCICAEEDDI